MADRTSNPTPEEIAQAITSQLAMREQNSGGGTDPRAIVLPASAEASTVNGTFTIAIEYNKRTYTLVIKIPKAAGEGQPYVFTLTETGEDSKPNNIVNFRYANSANWEADASLPPISLGDFTLKQFSISLGEGTVPEAATDAATDAATGRNQLDRADQTDETSQPDEPDQPDDSADAE